MSELSKMLNIGEVIEGQLEEIGVFTADELKSIGSKEAWLRIQKIDESACIHRLLALEGAIRGVKKTELPIEVKADLNSFYNSHKLKKNPNR